MKKLEDKRIILPWEVETFAKIVAKLKHPRKILLGVNVRVKKAGSVTFSQTDGKQLMQLDYTPEDSDIMDWIKDFSEEGITIEAKSLVRAFKYWKGEGRKDIPMELIARNNRLYSRDIETPVDIVEGNFPNLDSVTGRKGKYHKVYLSAEVLEKVVNYGKNHAGKKWREITFEFPLLEEDKRSPIHIEIGENQKMKGCLVPVVID